MRVHLFTCAWGSWHIDALTRVMWPTILGAGNLPALAARHALLYRICTTRADRERIEATPAFDAIRRHVPVEFDTDLLGDAPQIIDHMRWYGRVQTDALADRAVYLWLWPDVVFTDRTLGNAGLALERGKAGAALPTLRVMSETCLPELRGRTAASPGAPLPLSPGEVVRLGVRHMHPLSASSYERARHGKPGTSMLFRVPGEGLIARSANTWLFIDPTRLAFTAEGDVVSGGEDPAALVHVATDSDDMLFLSLAPLDKELESFIPGHAPTPLDIARMTLHPSLAASPFYELFDRVPTRLHYGAMTPAKWAVVEQRSDRLFRRVIALRRVLRLHAALTAAGRTAAAGWLARALHRTALCRVLAADGGFTIVVPADEACAEPEPGELGAPDRGQRRQLLRRLLDQVLPGLPDPPPGTAVASSSLTGRAVRLSHDGDRMRIDGIAVRETLTVAGNRIHLLDAPDGGAR